MIERPPLRALFGALLLALLTYLLLNAPLRPLVWLGWVIGFFLLAGLLALVGRPSGTRTTRARGSSLPAEAQETADRLVELIIRARGLDASEAAHLVEAAWRGDRATLAAQRIMLRHGIEGRAALEALERRFSREARFADAAPWEPDAGGLFSAAGSGAPSADTPRDPSIPPGLESLFAGAKESSRSTPAPRPSAAELAGQTRVEWDTAYDPADGDPPPGGEQRAPLESLADFADELSEPLPERGPETVEGTVPPAPLPDIDPYAEEWDEPWSPSPRSTPVSEPSDDEDPFAALLPDAPIDEGSDPLDDDPWGEAPAPRRPNPFAPDEPLADPYRRGGGAFRAPLREERPKR